MPNRCNGRNHQLRRQSFSSLVSINRHSAPCRVDQHEGVAPPQLLDVGRQRLVAITLWPLLDGRPATFVLFDVLFVLMGWGGGAICGVCLLPTRGASRPSTAKRPGPNLPAYNHQSKHMSRQDYQPRHPNRIKFNVHVVFDVFRAHAGLELVVVQGDALHLHSMCLWLCNDRGVVSDTDSYSTRSQCLLILSKIESQCPFCPRADSIKQGKEGSH